MKRQVLDDRPIIVEMHAASLGYLLDEQQTAVICSRLNAHEVEDPERLEEEIKRLGVERAAVARFSG